MPVPRVKHTIEFFVYPKFELLDLSGPCAAFNLANELYAANYRMRVVSSKVSVQTPESFLATGVMSIQLMAAGRTGTGFPLRRSRNVSAMNDQGE